MSVIPFSGCPIDRAEHERRDSAWIEAWERREEARFLPVWRLQVLVKEASGPELAWARSVVREHMNPRVGAILLGLHDGVAHFAVDLSQHEDPLGVLGCAGAARFADVRALATQLDAADAATAGFARARVDWHARHGYCSTCGARTEIRAGGAQRVCPQCKAEHFPRTDPVAISVVERDGLCLLGRQRMFPPEMFSALAGFIDSSESIEEAVAREVHEEVGLTVERVRYIASQPWPFPCSLMIGCIAEAEPGDVHVDSEELEDAQWFTRDQVRRALAGERGVGLMLPPPMAIANHLLRRWISE
jgi:NAD+ diphosphatase